MGAVHVRTPKNFVLEERLERYADAIETNPEAYPGDWRKACAPADGKPFEHHRCRSCLPQASSMPSLSTFPRRSPRPSTPKNDSSMSTI